MTTRLAGVLVTFERDIREDDAAATLAALRQIKGVLHVEPVPSDVHLGLAEARARFDISQRVYEALQGL
jgi:hypothetical protein